MYFFSLNDIKWKINVGFDEKCIVKNLFPKYKRSINIEEVDIKKIVLSSKELYGNKGEFKSFIVYISNAAIVPLYIRLPQMNAFVKYFDSHNKYMNLLVHDKEALKKYNEIWNKV